MLNKPKAAQGIKGLRSKTQGMLDKMARGYEAKDVSPELSHDELDDAANTLLKAQDIQQNKALMHHVNKHLAKKKHAIGALQQMHSPKSVMDKENAKDESDPLDEQD